jgi:hypothetical protein
MFRPQMPVCPVVVGHDYGLNGDWGIQYALSKLSAHRIRIYSIGLVLFAFSHMFQGGTNGHLLNLDTIQPDLGDPN